MNRRNLMRFLPAFLLPAAMRGQLKTGDCIGQFDGKGGYKVVPCPQEPTRPIQRLAWPDGKPLNNQCPVCGTMAEPFKKDRNGNIYSGLILTMYDDLNQTYCRRCNNVFVQRREF